MRHPTYSADMTYSSFCLLSLKSLYRVPIFLQLIHTIKHCMGMAKLQGPSLQFFRDGLSFSLVMPETKIKVLMWKKK